MRILLFILVVVLGLFIPNSGNAQFQFESSKEYGQLLDIRYSPTTENLLFARSLTNHILRSSDGGQNWEIIHSVPQDDFFIQVKDLKITHDGNYLTYICTAEGTAMNRIELFNVQTEQVEKTIYSPIGEESGSLIQSYSIFKEDLDVIFLHTTRFINWGLVTELFYTQDGGENWTSVYYSPSNSDVAVNNVAISPFNSQKLYMMRGPSPWGIEGGLWISENAGQSWEEALNNINLMPITFHESNPNTVYLGSFYLGVDQTQKLYRTTNNGMSWVEMVIDWTDLSSNSIQDILINPNNDQNIVVLEENEIVISHDGGVNWESHVYDGENLEQYYYGVNGSFNPFEENELIISANYYPFISTDGGVNLAKLETPFVNSTGRMGVFGGENQHLYYGVRGGFVHKNMATGEEMPIGLSELGFTPNITMMGPYVDPNVEGRVFVGYSNWMGNASIMMSNDHGENSTLIHSNSYIFLMAADSFKANPNLIMLSFGELVYKFDVTDLENIVQTQISLPGFDIVEDVQFGQNENELIIVQGKKIYKTLDNGANWTELSNGLESLNNEFIFDLAINPNNPQQWAIGTSLGIFTTEDAGNSWVHSFVGQSYHTISFSDGNEGVIIATSRFEDGYLYPSAHSQLVFTTNNGETWEEISTDIFGFMRTMNSDVLFHEDAATVYFLTPDLGVVGYEVDLEVMSISDQNIQEFTLYPNPSSGPFEVKSNERILQIEIFNFQGQKMKSLFNGNWNISELPKGIYLLKMQTEKGKIHFQKLIKK